MYEKSVFIELAFSEDRGRFVNYVTKNLELVKADIALGRYRSSPLDPHSYKGALVEIIRKRVFLWKYMSLKWVFNIGYNVEDIEECFHLVVGFFGPNDLDWLLRVQNMDIRVLERSFFKIYNWESLVCALKHVRVKKCKFRRMTSSEKSLVKSMSNSRIFKIKITLLY